MSANEDRKVPHEIVIVRRKAGGHGDGHHGGAWKIAFADFMTALMCFFLVMWLINSTDKKTITQVATYFNPLRLNDRTASQKGLSDPAPHDATSEQSKDKEKEKEKKKEKAKGKEAAKSAKENKQDAHDTAAAPTSEGAERELFRDPYGVLDRIAAGEAAAAGVPALHDTSADPRMPRDVFDVVPGRSMQKPGAPGAVADGGREEERTAPPGPGAALPAATPELPESKRDLGRQIQEAVADLKPGTHPNIEIVDLGQEILISLTDEFDFGMFAIASARPTRELMTVMERIARVLQSTPGNVAIRGHTDGRPYRGVEYDNWRLSMARAQVATYMLVRGGLQEERVKRIEGHADRSLKVAKDPLAAQNRRIEILVAKGVR
jgi:chemotaxis protein MotB